MRKPEEIEDIFDLTDEELDKFSDEDIDSISERTPGDMILPFGTRRRYLARKEYQRVQELTKNTVRAYIKGGELGVDFTNLHEPRFADNAVTVEISDESMERLKGDQWREEVLNILKNNR